MIILTNTTDKIIVDLLSAVTTNQLKCFVSYRDTTATSITPGRNVISTNNTTAVDLVPSPAASTQRIVDYISIFNNDTTNENVTIQFSDNGSLYDLFVTTLSPGDKIEYQEGQGFKVLTNNGSIKTSLNQGNNPLSSAMQSVVTSTDVVNNNAVANTMADITGLSFNVLAGNRYYFKFVINYSSAATTTGSRFSVSGPASPFSLNYTSEYSLTATTTTRNANNISYDLPATSNASSAQAITFGGNLAVIEGFIIPSADGTVIGRFASEVANSAITVKTPSIVYYQLIA